MAVAAELKLLLAAQQMDPRPLRVGDEAADQPSDLRCAERSVADQSGAWDCAPILAARCSPWPALLVDAGADADATPNTGRHPSSPAATIPHSFDATAAHAVILLHLLLLPPLPLLPQHQRLVLCLLTPATYLATSLSICLALLLSPAREVEPPSRKAWQQCD
jgi:hypothetical protein